MLQLSPSHAYQIQINRGFGGYAVAESMVVFLFYTWQHFTRISSFDNTHCCNDCNYNAQQNEYNNLNLVLSLSSIDGVVQRDGCVDVSSNVTALSICRRQLRGWCRCWTTAPQVGRWKGSSGNSGRRGANNIFISTCVIC